MKIKEITASRVVRQNLGDYESTDHFISMTAELGEGDTVIEAGVKLRYLLDAAIFRAVYASVKMRGKLVKPDTLRKRYGLTVPKES